MRVRCLISTVALAFIAIPGPALSQSSTADEDEVLAVVERLFDGMRAADSSMVRSTLHPDARLVSPYAFYLGEELSHCGVDAFQLFDGAEGWKIFHIADTRRREGCEIPAEVSGG